MINIMVQEYKKITLDWNQLICFFTRIIDENSLLLSIGYLK